MPEPTTVVGTKETLQFLCSLCRHSEYVISEDLLECLKPDKKTSENGTCDQFEW